MNARYPASLKPLQSGPVSSRPGLVRRTWCRLLKGLDRITAKSVTADRSGLSLGYIRIGLIYVIAYVALDRISFINAWSVFGFTLWNPPPALSLALVIARGPAFIPLLLLGPFAGDYFIRGAMLGPATSVASALVLSLGYATLAMVIRRIGPIDLLRGSMRDLALILLLIPAGVFIVAACYVGTFVMLGFLRPADYVRAMTSFWVGDVTGILALLPCLLLAMTRPSKWRERMRGATFDLIIFVTALSASLWLIFVAGLVNELRFFYLFFIPIIWIAIRRGITGAALGVLLIEASVVGAVLMKNYSSDTFLAFQMFFLIIGATGLLLGAVVTARDQTQLLLRRQQAEVDRVARLTSIGVMGTALAHEISQPLASIATYAHACQLRLDANPIPVERIRRELTDIIDQTARAGQVLRQLRDFVAEGRIQPRSVDLTGIVQRVSELLRRDTAMAAITLEVEADPLPKVIVDPVQMEQVLLNIMGNAIEATANMRPAGGTVRIRARVSRSMVDIVVEDQGSGVDSELGDRIFEPFVTTKSAGMGLGLTIGQSIMEAHGGKILHENMPHGGARFTIRIPIGQ